MTRRAPGPGWRGWPAAAAAGTGVLGWLTLVAAARSLGPVGFAGFAAAWGLFFGLGGALSGLQQEVTRALAAGMPGQTGGGPRVLTVGAASGGLLALLLVSASVVTGLGGATAGWLAVGALLLTGLVLANALAALEQQWGALAVVALSDAGTRLALVLAVLVAGGGAPERAAAIALAPAAGAAWLLRGGARRTLREPLGLPWGPVAARVGAALAAAGATALLVTGLPFLLAMVRRDADTATGVLLATLVLVRAPLMVVVFAYRPVLLAGFLRAADVALDVRGWWLRIAGAVVLAAAPAALVGPWLLRLVDGPAYRVGATAVLVLMAGVGALAMLVVSGLALVARDRHAASLAGWLVAVGVTVALLAAVPAPGDAVLAAVAGGPVPGLLVHGVALRRDAAGRLPGAVAGD